MTAPIRPIAAVDVPLHQLREAVAQLGALHTLMAAAAHAKDPSDCIAYALDIDLIAGDIAVSTDADYPGFAEHIAAREAANRKARQAHLEAS